MSTDKQIGIDTDYYSCFISYSHEDHEFAERLYADLQSSGVRCWFDLKDLKWGDAFLVRNSQAIQLYDKFLLILSQHSIISKRVELDVGIALNREVREQKTVILPMCLDDSIWNIVGSWPDLIRDSHIIGDFRGWKNHDDYQKAYMQLLSALKVNNYISMPNVESIGNTSMLGIRINEEPLTAQNLTTIISTLTELYTKCWLILQGRFPDFINYAQTHDIRFTNEANLTIGKLAHNSPTLVELILNPTTLAAAAGAVVTLAGALKIAIDNIGQTSLRFKEKELDIEIRRQEAQQAQQTAEKKASLEEQKAQLEIEKQQLEIDRERLEVGKNRVEVALETASKMVDILRPSIDMETKGMLVQALLPSLLQLGTTEGLEVVSDGDEAPKEDNLA